MLRVDRKPQSCRTLRTALVGPPRPMFLPHRRFPPLPPSLLNLPLAGLLPASLIMLALTTLCSAGCQGFVSPLAGWNAAYDGSLVTGPTKEEMSDVSALRSTPIACAIAG